MSYRNAQVPQQMQDNTNDLPLYFQWHHGTDSRGDALADGGWEAECAKYPGLNLTLPKGQVKHASGSILAWHAPALTIAVLAQETRWFTGGSAEPVEVRGYAPGAWSRMRVLAWVAEIERPAVLTLRASASSDLGRGLKAFRSGPLALARRDVPGLPLAAFYLTVEAGVREKRGTGNNTSYVTPPVVLLPDEDADDDAIRAWLDDRYVGDSLLALFARLPDLAQFKQRSAQPAAARNGDDGDDEAEQYGAVGNEAMDAFYREAQARGLNPQQIIDLLSHAGQDPAAALDILTTMNRQTPPPPASPHDDDDFEAMRSASEEPEVKAALAQAAAQPHFPVPQRTAPAIPTNGAAALAAEHALPAAAHEAPRPATPAPQPPPPAAPAEDAAILATIRDLERQEPFNHMTGFATKETWGMWQTLATQTLAKLGHGDGKRAFWHVTARLAGVDLTKIDDRWQAKQSSAKAWLHWLSVKDAHGQPVRPTQVSAKSAREMDVICRVAEAELAADEAPAF